MPQYTLEFEDDGFGEPKRVEFKAQNPAGALSLLENELALRHAKVWEGDTLIADIMRDRQGIWHIDEHTFG
ncbi:hypothetical protein K3148_00930 [Qipengyuania aurantiaca]|uniref:Uncharacterized protein n=1 Tax=Qipengyuania aurantiaca TaxID=2867233 RepID=A0ABX8ZLX0_9SPHN|nr:hypothetical protein [Qipengyuania aurantiaca]QZD90012.1 hypothetical protein K3148_00930 [Qipengyuania aurantiaca]